jgi:hypothetical protein
MMPLDEYIARLRSFDLETHLTQDGLGAPPIVCGSSARFSIDDAGNDRTEGNIYDRRNALLLFRQYAASDVIIAGANIAYDFGCIAAAFPELIDEIYKLFDECRVYDVQIAQALDAIAGGHLGIDPRDGIKIRNDKGKQTGRYSLHFCTDYMLGRSDAKNNDFWRLRYAILEDVPIELWPREARQYPIDDAVNTIGVAVAQLRRPLRNLENLPAQVEAAFALHLGSLWGLRTDPERVAKLEAIVEVAHAKTLKRFQTLGFIRPDGTEDGCLVKRAVATAYGASGTCPKCSGAGRVANGKTYPGAPKRKKGEVLDDEYLSRCREHKRKWLEANAIICKGSDGGCDGTGYDLDASPSVPRTDKGGVSTSRDTKVESGDEDLAAYGEDETEKLRDTYLPFVREGVDKPINARPNVLLNTGRCSYESLVQLLPRHGGVRECFIARPGCVFCSADFGAIQLCTLAQVCLWVAGYSRMAETINETGDPGLLHTTFAAQLVGKPVAEVIKLVKAKDPDAKGWRQAAKAGNFGFPGGMGAAKLVLSKRQRSEGKTVGPDGRVYSGIRFCILLGGASACGVEKVIEWKDRPTPPICKRCVEIVEYDLRPAWFSLWPEIKPYFAWVSMNVESTGELPCFGYDPNTGKVRVLRVRGGLDFCSGANNGFQALESDIMKDGLCEVTRECYTDRSSVLYGTRPLLLNHDDVFAEMPAQVAHVAAYRMADILKQASKRHAPDVAFSIEPALMYHMSKDAEPCYDATGKLIPWVEAT